MLALRLTDPNDYTVLDDGQPIGRIRLARERSLPIWLWTVTVTIPGPPFGDAKNIGEAKARFKVAWLAFKDKVGSEALAKAYAAMNHAPFGQSDISGDGRCGCQAELAERREFSRKRAAR
jgi:hypothetical protein